MDADPSKTADPWAAFSQQVSDELDRSRRALKEVNLMLDQSQAELNKMTQRSSNINAHLQQIQNQFDTVPRADIRMAYNSMLDAQQRLLVMRGQIEKLQNDQANMQRYTAFLDQVKEFLAGDIRPAGSSSHAPRGGKASLEKLINAQESERQRLSRAIHDGPAQALSNFIVQAEIADRLFEIDPVKAKEELDKLKSSAMSTFQKVRAFITDLRPMMLDDLGLVPTIKRYVENYKDETGVDASINIKGTERRLEPYLEVFVFRSIQELMSNTVRHNQDAPSKPSISIQMALEDDSIRIVVTDTGKGFKPEELSDSQGLSLKLIQERLEMLDGSCDIDSAPGQGTRVTLQIPVVLATES
jgi:two-component system sensor histidine kinase DegS